MLGVPLRKEEVGHRTQRGKDEVKFGGRLWILIYQLALVACIIFGRRRVFVGPWLSPATRYPILSFARNPSTVPSQVPLGRSICKRSLLPPTCEVSIELSLGGAFGVHFPLS